MRYIFLLVLLSVSLCQGQVLLKSGYLKGKTDKGKLPEGTRFYIGLKKNKPVFYLLEENLLVTESSVMCNLSDDEYPLFINDDLLITRKEKEQGKFEMVINKRGKLKSIEMLEKPFLARPFDETIFFDSPSGIRKVNLNTKELLDNVEQGTLVDIIGEYIYISKISDAEVIGPEVNLYRKNLTSGKEEFIIKTSGENLMIAPDNECLADVSYNDFKNYIYLIAKKKQVYPDVSKYNPTPYYSIRHKAFVYYNAKNPKDKVFVKPE